MSYMILKMYTSMKNMHDTNGMCQVHNVSLDTCPS